MRKSDFLSYIFFFQVRTYSNQNYFQIKNFSEQWMRRYILFPFYLFFLVIMWPKILYYEFRIKTPQNKLCKNFLHIKINYNCNNTVDWQLLCVFSDNYFWFFFHENLLDRTMSNPSALIIANKQQLNGRKLFLKHSRPEIFLKRVHAAKKSNLISQFRRIHLDSI